IEPPRPDKGLRILSPYFGILHETAPSCLLMHKCSNFNSLQDYLICIRLHRAARNLETNMHQNMHQIGPPKTHCWTPPEPSRSDNERDARQATSSEVCRYG